MVVEDEELAVRPQRRRDTGRPAVEVAEPAHNAFAGVDEVEAAPAQLARERLRVAVDPEDLRPSLARRLERPQAGIEARRHRTELRQRGGRLTGPAEEMENLLALQIPERPLHEGRQLDGLCARPMPFFPGAKVLLGRLHRASYAPSE